MHRSINWPILLSKELTLIIIYLLFMTNSRVYLKKNVNINNKMLFMMIYAGYKIIAEKIT